MIKRSSHRCLLGLVAVTAAGCATSNPYDAILASWFDAEEADLLRVWGPPTESHQSAGRKVLVYEMRRVMNVPGGMPIPTSTGPVSGSPSLDIRLACTTTFQLVDARVAGWSYAGNNCHREKGVTASR